VYIDADCELVSDFRRLSGFGGDKVKFVARV
jgi:hypothetical protein